MSDDNNTVQYTPITKEPIREVRADKWHEMSVTELFDQRGILIGRLNMAASMRNQNLMQQVQRGIDAIDAILSSKADTESKLL